MRSVIVSERVMAKGKQSRKTRQNSRQVLSSPIDRLSSLPDAILCDILYFLNTKEAVATSVLARRWRFLWQDVPCLEFDIDDYDSLLEEPDKDIFLEIINKVLLLHKSQNLSSFSLSTKYYHLQDLVEYDIGICLDEWMKLIVSRNVQKLKLQLELSLDGYEHLYPLPDSLLMCETLVDLELLDVTIYSDPPVRLPHLKKLHLSSVRYEDDESLPQLLSGCSMLEDLLHL